MDFFMPSDCAIDTFTPYWLLVTMGALAIAALALLALVWMLWRQEAAAGFAWWRRLPLALPTLWAVICGLLATQAWAYYGDITTPLQCGPVGICSYKGVCMPIAELVSEARFALLVTAVALIVGWFVSSRITRRMRRA